MPDDQSLLVVLMMLSADRYLPSQVICTNLVDFIMLGLVFARFSAPYKRASSIRFTTSAIVQRHSSGYWCLCFR